jgi:peptide/nickel transport system permease protein
VDISSKLIGPSADHWLGTDHFGRDILSMIMVGARTSIAVAVVAVGIGMALGIPLGLLASAHAGGWIDEILMRANDLVFAFPSLVIAILITAVWGASAVNAIIAIGVFNIPVFARLSRGAALALWPRDFVLAARVAGKGRARISVEHILPNLASLMIVQGTISSRSASWPRRGCPMWAWVPSPRRQAGGACSPTRRPWWRSPRRWRFSPASPSC